MKSLTSISLVLLSAAHGFSAVLYDLNDTVLAGDTGANTFFVANSAGSPAGLSYSGSGPTLTDTLSGSGSYTYFVAYTDSATLTNIGDSITLSYSLTPSSATAFNSGGGAFRVGLFNSNGTKLTANVAGDGASELNNDTGYSAYYQPGSSATGNTFRQRTGTNNNLWQSGANPAVSGSPDLASPGTGTITGTFTLTLVATGVQITSVLNGGAAQSVIDTSGLVTTFDSFSIFANSGSANPTLTFSDLTVTFTPIPEPSSLVLLGASGAALLGIRRRVRRKQTSEV
jgi:hypothetical protein